MESHKSFKWKASFHHCFFPHLRQLRRRLLTLKVPAMNLHYSEIVVSFFPSKPELSRRHELIFINFFIIPTPSACQLITKKWIQQCVNSSFFALQLPKTINILSPLWAFRFAFCRSLMLLWIVDGSQCCQQRNKAKKKEAQQENTRKWKRKLFASHSGFSEEGRKWWRGAWKRKLLESLFFLAQQILM